MSEETEVKGLVEQVNVGLSAIKSELETVKKSVAQTGEFQAKLDKITEEVTRSAETLQEQKRKTDAINAAMNRLGDSSSQDSGIVAESKAAFVEFLRKGQSDNDKFTKIKEGSMTGYEVRSMSTNNNANGGYLVVPEIADFMVKREFETSPMRSLARVMTISNKSIEVIIDDNEVGSGWDDEGDSAGETTTPEIGKLQIVAHKLSAEPKVTTEMLEDPFVDVEAWLGQGVADKFARDENTAFASGASPVRPQGFLTLSAWASEGVYERNKLEQVNLGGASTITGDGLIALQASLKEVYQGNANFVMHRATFGQVLKLKGNDNYFFGMTFLKDGNSSLMLLGKPVTFFADMPLVASNALSVAYGDFARSYTIVDRVGLQMLRDPYTSKGWVKFYTTKRVGGAVTSFDALKIGKVAA
jgi:HK97 family phage major capsid protein